MSKVVFQSDHQSISFWNIDTFKPEKTKTFNGTNMVNYGFCYEEQKSKKGPEYLNIYAFFGVRITSNNIFQLEKLSPQ